VKSFGTETWCLFPGFGAASHSPPYSLARGSEPHPDHSSFWRVASRFAEASSPVRHRHPRKWSTCLSRQCGMTPQGTVLARDSPRRCLPLDRFITSLPSHRPSKPQWFDRRTAFFSITCEVVCDPLWPGGIEVLAWKIHFQKIISLELTGFSFFEDNLRLVS